MQIIYLIVLVILFAAVTNRAQTVSSTPAPPLTESVQSDAKTADEIPVKLSKPLYETKTAIRHIIVSVRSSNVKEFASLGFRLEMYVRDRLPEGIELNEEKESFVFLIDGESFPASKVLKDKTINLASNSDGSVIYTRTYMLDIPVEKIKRTQSIAILWNEENINISTEGLNILVNFIEEKVTTLEKQLPSQ